MSGRKGAHIPGLQYSLGAQPLYVCLQIELLLGRWHNLPNLPAFIRTFNGLVSGRMPGWELMYQLPPNTYLVAMAALPAVCRRLSRQLSQWLVDNTCSSSP